MLVCYPQPGKQRSFEILQALSSGWGGGDASAFYGVVGIERRFATTRANGCWLYGDNSFFDCTRGKFFRFARNELQVSTPQPADHGRLAALGVALLPWHKDGRHVVVVEQSGHFLRLSGADEDWLARTTRELAAQSDRPLRIRRWSRDKGVAAATLAADLDGAWALVTHMSAAANEALMAGIPVFVTGLCAATPMASGPLAEIERPRYPEGRGEWAAGLANRQWTMEELRAGLAWKALT